MSLGRRVSFYTLGCRLNQAETAQIAQRFQARGYEIREHGDSVDVAVIHTCSVTERADQRCRQEIRKIHRGSPEALVCAVGCYAQSEPETVRSILGVDIVAGNELKYSLPLLVDEYDGADEPRVARSSTVDFARVSVPEEGLPLGATRANLKVQDGCDFHCAFCLLPRVRGRSRSRSASEIVAAATALGRRGHREIVVTGVNIGLYRDGEVNLGMLVTELAKADGVDRIRISSIEPTTVPIDLIDFLAEHPKACRHLHLPLQSGSDSVLERMRRVYTLPEFARFVERTKERIPDLTLGTDVIVGFPCETDEEFEASRRFVEEMPFDYLHVFSYSDRPKTAARRSAGKVHSKTIKERSKVLRAIGTQMKSRFLERLEGRRLEVLFESVDDDGLRKGLTRNYARVGVSPDQARENDLRPVTLRKRSGAFCEGVVSGPDIRGSEEGR